MLERIAREKHSSLLQRFINYDHKFFITLTSGGRDGFWRPEDRRRPEHPDIRDGQRIIRRHQ